jgi:predicted phosphate transport protein (TIGR00153 family)
MGMNIFDLLLPKETKFYSFMDQQVSFLVTSTAVFKDLVENIKTLTEDQIKEKLVKIKECETGGDEVERQILDELKKTFITPIDREDIHTLAINIDRANDILNSISRKIEIYNIREVPANVLKFADIIVKITNQMDITVKHLREKANIDDAVKLMRELENEADELFHESMAELFDDKNDPIYIIKFKEFYEHLETVVDAIDYVGKLMRGIRVKHG